MLCAILAVTNTAKSQLTYTAGSTSPIFPSSYFSLESIGIGKNLSTQKGGQDLLYFPKLLVHSSNNSTNQNIGRAILRIQDKHIDDSTLTSTNKMGKSQIQFWSNEYHTENEWFAGKIQAVTNSTITGDILNGSMNIPGGMAFYSKMKEAPITNWAEPIETMRIIDNKVTIGTQIAENIFTVSPKSYLYATPMAQWDNYGNNIAFDLKVNQAEHQSLLQKFYKWTGTASNSYAWHFEISSQNVLEQYDTYGAFNICSRNETGAPNTELSSNMPPATGRMNRLLTIERTGNVGIGIENPKEKLHVNGKAIFGTETITTGAHTNYQVAVNGKLIAREIIVTTDGWADFVFEDNYNLPTLKEVETHIKSKKHLPGIPSANEVITNGANIGEVQVKLLQKIEELTLYLIEQDKKIKELQNQINNK